MRESRESGTGAFLWVLQNFQDQLFCRIHLWTHTCVKWSIKKIFAHKIYLQKKHWWRCHLKYSCSYEGVEFYLKGAQSQILSSKICEVLQSFSPTEHYLQLDNCFWFPATFLTYRLLCQHYISSVTISCLGIPEMATYKRSTLSALKMFKGSQKKNKTRITFLGLRSIQRTKGYLVEVVSPEVLCEKRGVKYLSKFTGKYLYRRLFKNKFVGSRPASLFKKTLLDMCFSVNFLKPFGAALL